MITLTPERAAVVDFTTFTFFNEMTFMSHSPKAIAKTYLLMAPFDQLVWACTFVSAVVFLVMMKMIISFKQKNFSPSFVLNLEISKFKQKDIFLY